MTYPVVILGTGGHARVLIEILRLHKIQIVGATDVDSNKRGQFICGVKVIGNDDEIAKRSPETVFLVNGIGSVRVTQHRGEIFGRFKTQGYKFATVIHPLAIIAADTVISEGVQIMAGGIVQTGARIGMNTIINTNAVIEHDCEIGAHVHVASGVTLCGDVRVGDYAHVGAGATVIQQVRIGAKSLVAAGAVATKDVTTSMTVAGVPAREISI